MTVRLGLGLWQQQIEMAELKKATKRIIITSESVNYYGFRVLTDGVDLTQFGKNPLMLWMHQRAFGNSKDIILGLGNVIELRREVHPELGKVITGLPAFDSTDEFAMRIYEKYENGSYRMASAGLIPRDWSDDPELILVGQRGETLTKSVLQEVSLCDIGGNDDALQIALYNEANERIELSLKGENAAIPLITNPKIDNEMKLIQLNAERAAEILGLNATDTPAVFEAKMNEVVQLAQSQKTQIEKLTLEKSEADAKVVKLTHDLKEATEAQTTAKIETMVQLAVDERKITAEEKAVYIKLAATDFESVETLLKAKVGVPSVEQTLAKEKKLSAESLAGKTWDDLDKSGELETVKLSNMPLFEQLYKARFGKDYVKA